MLYTTTITAKQGIDMVAYHTTCHAQLLVVTIHGIWLVGFSVEVVLPSLVQ